MLDAEKIPLVTVGGDVTVVSRATRLVIRADQDIHMTLTRRADECPKTADGIGSLAVTTWTQTSTHTNI